ncbi:MAG: glycogen synthase GlgA [Thermodesulfobacteriota bacterium]
MNESSLSVLVAASEAAPLAQTGGLAEVTGSLPSALRDIGCRVTVVMPAYRRVLETVKTWEVAARDLPVRIGQSNLTADVLSGELVTGVPLHLVRRDEFFDRTGLYGSSQGDYFDNPERFVFFSRVIPALCSAIGFTPDVILGNDWQTGLIMALLNQGALPRTAGVFCVHNQGFLGLVPPERTINIGLTDRYYTMEGMEYYGQMSLLKAGIVYAQAVTTVSPSYAQEVQTPEGGHGLDGVMRSINWRLFGILNGVDYRVWNPALDANLAANYSPQDLSGKLACKEDLLAAMGRSNLLDKPLLGMVTRLTPQKGLGLLSESLEDLFKLDVGLVILGSGDARQEEQVRQMLTRYPDRMAGRFGYDPPLAHKIIAGCDMILMPSMYEPCGLAQMYGLKYGTVPVVRAVGGLNDTVKDPGNGNGQATGFKFGPFQARSLVRAVKRAVESFREKERWRTIMLAGMAEDFSWNRSAREYLKVFEQALSNRRG